MGAGASLYAGGMPAAPPHSPGKESATEFRRGVAAAIPPTAPAPPEYYLPEPDNDPPTSSQLGDKARAALILATVIALAASGVGVFLGARLTDPSGQFVSAAPEQRQLADVLRTAQRSVVSVHTKERTGSGVIANSHGTILTSLDVVDGGGAVTIEYSDGTRSKASVKKADPVHHLAVLSASTHSTLPAAKFGASGLLAQGDNVYALGGENAVNQSAISSLNYAITLPGKIKKVEGVRDVTDVSRWLKEKVNELLHGPQKTKPTRLRGLIHLSASIATDSSGGALINHHGRVVGVLAALGNGEDTKNLHRIAVPIEVAKKLL